MERILLTNCAVLCVVVLFIGVIVAVPHNNYEASGNDDKDDKEQEFFWMGPRLGRRKRTLGDESYRRPDMDREQLATLMDVIQDSPWAIVAVNEGKRHAVNFTPRLGRESGEDFISSAAGDRWLQDPEISGELLSQRSPPFAPRLGRRLSPYSPRLGRENDKNQMP